MRKNLIRLSIVVCFIVSLTSCGSCVKITYTDTNECQKTTVQDSTGRKITHETTRTCIQVEGKVDIIKIR